jgi:hypothetical protein
MNEKVVNWLGIEDFFNYYLPGLLWIGNITLILLALDENLFNHVLNSIGQINEIVLLGLGIVSPYLAGILTGFLGRITHKIDQWIAGKPEIYVLDKNKKKTYAKRFIFGSALGDKLVKDIKVVASKIFGQKTSPESLFFNIHYSILFCPYPRVQQHIARITNLMNLHEGFLPPLLLTSSLIFILAKQHQIAILWRAGVICLLLFIGTWYRYHYLRETRAKHVLRYFYLWKIVGNTKEEISKGSEQV